MAKPRTVDMLLADRVKLFELMQTATDFIVAVVVTAYLDASLELLLRSRFQNSKAADELLDDNRPLASFGARYHAARAIGLIDETAYGDLKQIGKIRDRFAHYHLALDFGDQEIVDRCRELSLSEHTFDHNTGEIICVVPRTSESLYARTRFLMMASYYSGRFLQGAGCSSLPPSSTQLTS